MLGIVDGLDGLLKRVAFACGIRLDSHSNVKRRLKYPISQSLSFVKGGQMEVINQVLPASALNRS